MQTTRTDLTAQTISIVDGRRGLRVAFSDGRSVDIGADRMRAHCRCAACSRARIDGAFVTVAGMTIEQVNPIGQYGVNVSFSDGHARGIYPYGYLSELAAFEAVADEASAGSSGRVRQAPAV